MLHIDLTINNAGALFQNGIVAGSSTTAATRRIRDLPGVFFSEEHRRQMDPDTVVYRVYSHETVGPGTSGGLFFGVTHLCPGLVGSEYFMTRGHTHEHADRAEYYWGMEGEGLLVLFDAKRAWVERIVPGSLHYVPGYTAHRVVNCSTTIMKIGACWPSDAGHNYDAVAASGFPVLVCEKDGRTVCSRNSRFPN